MKIIFLTHHEEFRGFSMTRYTEFLNNGFQELGYKTEVWAPNNFLAKYSTHKPIKKWLRYIDTFVYFPFKIKRNSKKQSKNTLYVLIDQALGMWMPFIENKLHVVHCHDFIALKSALGRIPENKTSWTGKQYQHLIFKGFSKANNFLCISKNTEKELLTFLKKKPDHITHIYNAIDPMFKVGKTAASRYVMSKHLKIDVSHGYLLHVGGGDFYKNKKGVIAIYDQWRTITNKTLPLLLIGSAPNKEIKTLFEASPFKNDIHFLIRVENHILLNAYQGASLFLFPSLAEGFGWPIAEAMACACPVITTNAAPMNEVGGKAAIYIDPCISPNEIKPWATKAAKVIDTTLNLSNDKLISLKKTGLEQVKNFNGKNVLLEIESFYKSITTS
ncbi:glycosyltransferase family 1 protein [Maribacter sp. SA7]|uniref:glycosyltransferase family 4 protein n=1 Tax=Maribacter zhoushanensis TaxID=3030012 RepID=UPI0023EB31D5|nr:glycosyltransferase family 1 protein [Maribacter zhoushanensis]MDF4201870.1 glycosyltransferase family 1 protein [Maribacter zhoushanensis]